MPQLSSIRSLSLLTFTTFCVLLSTSQTVFAQQTTVNGNTVDLATCENVESQFTIQLMYMGPADRVVDDRYVAAFEAAAKRWTKVIVGDVPDLQAGVTDDWFGGRFVEDGGQSYSGAVDDIIIGYDIPTTIDGPGGQLGGAGPVFTRRDTFDRPLTTVSGVMFFDGQDLDNMPTNDVRAIIQHEMGHVLGLVGTTNERCTFACNAETAADNPSTPYSCPLATSEYDSIASSTLVLENQGGMGTACGHWEEDAFRTQESSEVMTGFFEANLFQPLSSVTVAALVDIGYEVDFCGADIWPASVDTIQRFEIYKMTQTMNMNGGNGDGSMTMERFQPQWGVDPETGEIIPWTAMDANMAMDAASGEETDTSTSSSIENAQQIVLSLFGITCTSALLLSLNALIDF